MGECTDPDCAAWRRTLRSQAIEIGGWRIYTRERETHGNRLRVNVFFDYVTTRIPLGLKPRDCNAPFEISISPPSWLEGILDDCNGDGYLKALNWLEAHPIKTGEEYPLVEISRERIFPMPKMHEIYAYLDLPELVPPMTYLKALTG